MPAGDIDWRTPEEPRDPRGLHYDSKWSTRRGSSAISRGRKGRPLREAARDFAASRGSNPCCGEKGRGSSGWRLPEPPRPRCPVDESRDRGRPIWPADTLQRLHQMVPRTELLRVVKLEGHLETRWRRRLAESGHS